MPALEQGTNAPPFALNSVESGKPVRLLYDRLTLLAFYKVTCPVCQMAIPYLDALKQYESDRFRADGVVEDPPDEAREFAREHGGTLETLSEPSPYATSAAFGLTNVPSVFLVEPGGRIARSIVGFNKQAYNEMAADIAARLGEPTVIVCPSGDGAPDFRPG